jgi:hypothetical protein
MAMNPRLMRPLARRQAPTFSPLSLTGLQLWLDATDSSSITLNSGNVSEWADKSPEGNDAMQATAISQPAYETAAVNGLTAVTFDGTDDFLDVAIPGIESFSAGFFAWVLEPVAEGSTDGYDPSIALTASDEYDLGALHYIKHNLSGASYPFYVSGVIPYDGQGSYSYGQEVLLSLEKNGGAASVYKNGTQEGGASNLPASTTASGLRLAAQPSPERYSNIRICEIIVCFGSVAGDREKAEGYLAHRWGLSGSLPSGHPYKSAPPS